jgi:hypothetical protein
MRAVLDKEFNKKVVKLAALLEKELRAHTPIDTGNARRNWNTKVKQAGAEVKNTVPYIERLENNWSKQTRGRGIIGPSLKKLPRRI